MIGTATDARTARRPLGAILVLPGGGYAGHAPHEGAPYAAWLTGLGYDAEVLRYSVGDSVGDHAWPAALYDARTALRHLRHRTPAHLPVGVVGSSAGGHLAAALSTATGPDIAGGPDVRPDFAILAYPVISFEVHPHPGSTRNLLGANPSRAARIQVSVDRHVDSLTTPTFVWTTADDSTVSAAHTLRYTQALLRAGVPIETHLFPHGPHGLGLAHDDPSVSAWTRLAERWLADLRVPVPTT